MNTITCPYCKKDFLNGKRSTSLNSYLHAIFGAILKEVGKDYTMDDIKDFVMNAVGETEYKTDFTTGEEKLRRKSTEKMNNQQCSELTDKVRKWAESFLCLYIPDADEFKQGVRSYKLTA